MILSILGSWLDCIFPPLCEVCKERCHTRFFCADCWNICALVDPLHRCRHCFQEIEEGTLCRICQRDPWLPFPFAYVFESSAQAYRLCREGKEHPDAMTAFMVVQWEKLRWPIPDVVVPLPGARCFAKSFSSWLETSYAPVLSRCLDQWDCDVEALQEDQTLLLLGEKVSRSMLQGAIEALSEAFPKKIYVLSLLHDFPLFDAECSSSPVSDSLFRDLHRS